MKQEGNRTANLNDATLVNVDYGYDSGATAPTRTASAQFTGVSVAVHFVQLQERLLEYIERADAVLGCVAWLTSEAVLSALGQKVFISLLIQKEDFLRPDLEANGGMWKTKLRQMYDALRPNDINRYSINGNVVSQLSVCGDQAIAPVRCVGFAGKEATRPRMHHKFLVFCDEYPELRPYAVWTGSFNFTKMATNSLENAVYISDPRVAGQFYREWEYVFALSEPLDWESEYCAPQYRIGT